MALGESSWIAHVSWLWRRMNCRQMHSRPRKVNLAYSKMFGPSQPVKLGSLPCRKWYGVMYVEEFYRLCLKISCLLFTPKRTYNLTNWATRLDCYCFLWSVVSSRTKDWEPMVKKYSSNGGRLGELQWYCMGPKGAAVEGGKAIFISTAQWQLDRVNGIWLKRSSGALKLSNSRRLGLKNFIVWRLTEGKWPVRHWSHIVHWMVVRFNQ